jgi:hypothetical protein
MPAAGCNTCQHVYVCAEGYLAAKTLAKRSNMPYSALPSCKIETITNDAHILVKTQLCDPDERASNAHVPRIHAQGQNSTLDTKQAMGPRASIASRTNIA